MSFPQPSIWTVPPRLKCRTRDFCPPDIVWIGCRARWPESPIEPRCDRSVCSGAGCPIETARAVSISSGVLVLLARWHVEKRTLRFAALHCVGKCCLFADGHVEHVDVVLRELADAELVVQLHQPGRRLEVADDAFEQRRLSNPIWPDQSDPRVHCGRK